MGDEVVNKANDFSNKEGFIWLDGAWVEWKEAKTHVLTNTLHYGLGVYDGARAYTDDNGTNPAVFRLHDHIERLYQSARLCHISVPEKKENVIDICLEALQKNNLTSAYIRPMVFLGSEGMGLHAKDLKPHLMVAAWEWGTYLGNTALTDGIRVKTSTYRRNSIDSLHARAKVNGHYVNSMLALKEAELLGFNEALMLDHLGFIAEGSGENFFMIKDGKIFTPLPYGILPGITRDSIMKIARDLNIPVEETNIARDAVYLADEAFFTGTAAEVTPICQLDAFKIGSGKPGPVTQKLQEVYFDTVKGKKPEYSHWLTPTNVGRPSLQTPSIAGNTQRRSFHTQTELPKFSGSASRSLFGSSMLKPHGGGKRGLITAAGSAFAAGSAALFSANRTAFDARNLPSVDDSMRRSMK